MYSANSTLAGYDGAKDFTTSLSISVYISGLPCTTGEMVTKDTAVLGNIKTSRDCISAGLYLILTVSEAVWNKI